MAELNPYQIGLCLLGKKTQLEETNEDREFRSILSSAIKLLWDYNRAINEGRVLTAKELSIAQDNAEKAMRFDFFRELGCIIQPEQRCDIDILISAAYCHMREGNLGTCEFCSLDQTPECPPTKTAVRCAIKRLQDTEFWNQRVPYE